MPLPAGTRLGQYELIGQIGAGGMGEVYRARDTKLGRDVALKILPALFATDPDRLGRFRREAQLLAALNHPNIGHIYGFEDSGAINALVLELIEGPTLAERIAAAPIPVSEALRIARQIAEALEAAHEAGIIHRDLKPGNVKVREDGAVKVLDFGLAKAMDPPGSHTSDATNSPTLTARATQIGVILGTAAYMAPEQAKGKPVDRRVDVWAFGVLLFEMLTGRRLFEGEDVSDTLAAVLTREPNWQQLPAETPPGIRRLLSRCLARDRRARLDSMSSVRLDIEEAIGGAGSTGASAFAALDVAGSKDPALHSSGAASLQTGGSAVRDAGPRTGGSPSILAIAGVAAASLIAGAAVTWLAMASRLPATSAADTTIVSSILAPAEVVSAFSRGFALSPDGQTLVISAKSGDGVRSLWRRRLSQPIYERVPGTEDAMTPFWSPDGREIGFIVAGAMKKVPVDGGIAQTISKATIFPTPSWGESGEILFGVEREASVFRVKPTGGAEEKVTLPGPAYAPQWIPGTRAFLFVGGTRTPELWAGSIDKPADAQRIMELESHDPGFLLSPSGVLFFNRAGVLNAQRLDAASRQLVGTPVAVGSPAGTPRAWFGATAGPDSVLLLAGSTTTTGGNPGDPASRLSWVDRHGTIVGDLAGPGRYWTVHLSPDGQRAVVNPDKDLWVIDARTHMRTRVTTAPDAISGAIWSPDSTQLLHRESGALWTRAADGQAKPTAVFKFTTMGFAALDWSKDGTKLLVSGRQPGPSGTVDLYLLTLANGTVTPLVTSEYHDIQGRLSANGKWVAYVSNATGRNEVYVRALEGSAAAVRVSSDGGEHPLWRRDSRELFFLSPTDEFIAVDLSKFDDTRLPGEKTRLFRMVVNDVIRDSYAPYDVAADGQRFLINVAEPPEPLTLIQGIGSRLAQQR